MGFYEYPQWWDVNCTRYHSACVCELYGEYEGKGGGITGFGVFMLTLVWPLCFAVRILLWQAGREELAMIKDKVSSLRAAGERARVLARRAR